MPDDHPHTQEKPPPPPIEGPIQPPKQDIPEALEYKLDKIIDGIKRMVGVGDPAKIGPFPDPRKFDPGRDKFPEYPDIPKSLEFKLDVALVLLGRILGWLVQLVFVVGFGLGAIIALLIAILAALGGIAPALAALIGLLSAIFILLAFFVIRLVVPLVRRLRW